MTVIEAVRGDITVQNVDAIVNAANRSLLGGGGVDGAIHAAAGLSCWQSAGSCGARHCLTGCPSVRRSPPGAGRLPARRVIHTVGPNANVGETDPSLLARCFTSSLAEAVRIGARSIAFPAVSAGVFGWEGAEVARVAVEAVRNAPTLAELDLVRFVLFNDDLQARFVAALG